MVYGGRWTRLVLRVYVDFIRGVPALAIIFSIYYLLPLIGLQLRELTAAALALSVFFTAHVTEVARGALEIVAEARRMPPRRWACGSCSASPTWCFRRRCAASCRPG